MNNDKPVIVNFHAEWCEPCKILTPKLMELIEPHDNLDLAVVDVEDNPELVHTFEVSYQFIINTIDPRKIFTPKLMELISIDVLYV